MCLFANQLYSCQWYCSYSFHLHKIKLFKLCLIIEDFSEIYNNEQWCILQKKTKTKTKTKQNKTTQYGKFRLNDVRFVFTSCVFVGVLMSYLCLYAYSDVQHIFFCGFVLFFFVLFTLCCQFSWIVIFDWPWMFPLWRVTD